MEMSLHMHKQLDGGQVSFISVHCVVVQLVLLMLWQMRPLLSNLKHPFEGDVTTR